MSAAAAAAAIAAVAAVAGVAFTKPALAASPAVDFAAVEQVRSIVVISWSVLAHSHFAAVEQVRSHIFISYIFQSTCYYLVYNNKITPHTFRSLHKVPSIQKDHTTHI